MTRVPRIYNLRNGPARAATVADPEHIVRLTWYVTSRDEYYAELAEIGAAYRAVMAGQKTPVPYA